MSHEALPTPQKKEEPPLPSLEGTRTLENIYVQMGLMFRVLETASDEESRTLWRANSAGFDYANPRVTACAALKQAAHDAWTKKDAAGRSWTERFGAYRDHCDPKGKRVHNERLDPSNPTELDKLFKRIRAFEAKEARNKRTLH